MKTSLVLFLAKRGGYSIPWLAPVLAGTEVVLLAVSYLKGKKDGKKYKGYS